MNEANNFQIAEKPPLVIPDVSNCPFSIVFNEDCVQGLKRFPDNYFDLAIVDPPYGLGMGATLKEPLLSFVQVESVYTRLKIFFVYFANI